MVHFPDGRLEEVDVLVDTKVEAFGDPILSLLKLIREAHDVHRVERVDEGQTEPEPVLRDEDFLSASFRIISGVLNISYLFSLHVRFDFLPGAAS